MPDTTDGFLNSNANCYNPRNVCFLLTILYIIVELIIKNPKDIILLGFMWICNHVRAKSQISASHGRCVAHGAASDQYALQQMNTDKVGVESRCRAAFNLTPRPPMHQNDNTMLSKVARNCKINCINRVMFFNTKITSLWKIRVLKNCMSPK